MIAAAFFFIIFTHAACAQPLASRVNELPAITLISADKIQTSEGSIKKIILNHQTSVRIPSGCSLFAHHTNMNVGRRYLSLNHPSGATLFSDAALAQQLDTLLASLEQQPLAIGYLRKIQFFALHDLFVHLASVAATINLIHPERTDASLALNKSYIELESLHALTYKSTITNYLLAMVQEQLYSIMVNYYPTLSASLALTTGKLLLEHDYGSNLNFLIQSQELSFFSKEEHAQATSIIEAIKASYLSVLKTYMNFFEHYSSSVFTASSSFAGATKAYEHTLSCARTMKNHAQHILNIQKRQPSSNSPQEISTNITRLNKEYAPINPPLLFYGKKTLEALRALPILAQTLAPSSPYGWPKHLIKAAETGELAKTRLGEVLGYPIAQLQTATGQTTTNEATAARLCIFLPIGKTIYEQEISKQPEWLNSYAGIMRMIRACMGDFSQALGLNVIDPCLEAIFIKIQQLTPEEIAEKATVDMSSIPQWRQCQDHLSIIRQTQQEYISAVGKEQKKVSIPKEATEFSYEDLSMLNQ